MPKAGKDPLEEIKAEIEKRSRKAAEEVASEVTFQVELAYEKAISKFYNDYDPERYERTLSTIKASNRWDDIFGYTPTKDRFIAGIEVGSENIPNIFEGPDDEEGHQPYRDPTDWVFERTYEKGIHGYTILEARRYADKKRKKYVLSKRAKNRLTNYINAAPPITSPPPKEIMEKLFSKIDKQQYIDKITDEKLKELFG